MVSPPGSAAWQLGPSHAGGENLWIVHYTRPPNAAWKFVHLPHPAYTSITNKGIRLVESCFISNGTKEGKKIIAYLNTLFCAWYSFLLSFHPTIHPSSIYPCYSFLPFIHPSTHSSIHPSMLSLPSIHPYIHLSMLFLPSIHPPTFHWPPVRPN